MSTAPAKPTTVSAKELSDLATAAIAKLHARNEPGVTGKTIDNFHIAGKVLATSVEAQAFAKAMATEMGNAKHIASVAVELNGQHIAGFFPVADKART